MYRYNMSDKTRHKIILSRNEKKMCVSGKMLLWWSGYEKQTKVGELNVG